MRRTFIRPSEENTVPQTKSCAATQRGWAGLAKMEAVRGIIFIYVSLSLFLQNKGANKGQPRMHGLVSRTLTWRKGQF